VIAKYISRGIIICKLLEIHGALGRNAWNVSNTWKVAIIATNQIYRVPCKILKM